jgi:hypothetical protein
MSRRRALLVTLTLAGAAAVGAAPLSSAAVPPIQACPPQPLVYESNGHDYVSVPDPSGKTCRITIELPVTVPPTLAVG